MFEQVHGCPSGAGVGPHRGAGASAVGGGVTRRPTLRGRPRGRLRAMTDAALEDLAAPDAPGLRRGRGRLPGRRPGPGSRRRSSWPARAGPGVSANHRSGSSTRHGRGRRTGAGATGRVGSPRRGAAGPGEPGSAVGRRAVDRLLHCRSSSYSSSATAGGGPPTGGRCRGAAEKEKGRGSRGSGSAASRRTGRALAQRSPRGRDTRGW